MTDRIQLVPSGHSKPVGKYSPGIAVTPAPGQRMIFVSGQVATDRHGTVRSPGDAGGQTEVVFERIGQVLAQAGGTLDDLVSLVIYLVNMKDFTAVSTVRNRVLGTPAPSSTLVQVAALAENGCLVEISGIAVIT